MNLLKMKYLQLILLLTLSSFSWIACQDDEQDFPVVYPTIKTVEVTVDTVNIYKVDVKVTASNANFYTIIFNEEGKRHFRETKEGEESYVFSSTGSFLIEIRANSTTEVFSETSRTVTIKDTSSTPGVDPGVPTIGYQTPLNYPGYTLVWQDEFNGDALNMQDWSFEIGTGNNGWGNAELQYYREQNTTVNNGVLTIEAKAESFSGSNYTSSRLITQGKESFQYGRIDIRAAMPQGKGMWPALWMLGDNITTVGWPKCGEIDIMEMVGGPTTSTRGDGTVLGTLHWERGDGVKVDNSGYRTLTSGKLADEWHVYSIIWDSNEIKWLLDDVQYHVLDITPPDMSEFHQNFFFIFNVAVGGNLPGPPDGTTNFPQKMYVDYVRVFQ